MPLGTQPAAQSPSDLLVRPDVTPKPQAPLPAHMAPPAAPQSDIMNLMLNVLQGVEEGTLLGSMIPGKLGAEPQRPMPWTQTGSMIGSMVAEPMPDVMPLLGAAAGMLGKVATRMKAPISAAGHTLERLGDTFGLHSDELRALVSNTRAIDPPPLDLKQFEQPQANETFDFRSLESSDHYSRYDNRPMRGPKTQVFSSSNPLTEAILQGATKPYAQSWAIRDASGDPRWIVESNLQILAIPVEGGVKEAPALVTDIASKLDEGVYSYSTEAGFNDLGLKALFEGASNILAWYKQHGLRPEYVGGWRVKYDRQAAIPVEKLEKEFTRAWIAAFGTAALVPRIIFTEERQPNE